ncbi:NAD-dependent epimerase/dehydratase family protein [Antrihabitans cavernicola]|uniref:NAD-dependent epimerase/dehydratase family protein n=1 Tax=Antrihabitans cavernicola TaxID=2495913 RepID=A0A5A7SJ22_9NOCA|nr:NAD-dependent epimerase/dehydratase family protein [Spelaeibacter cavernicola]KAA0024613.1 NAD-dependent epimerase/dehydratase family protein [Spelaeibacter cavernicola]
MTAPTWLVGSGGLLGGALTRELGRRGSLPTTSAVPWHSTEQARAVLTADARRFIERVGDGPWRLVWCAGAGVNGTSVEAFAAEHGLLGAVLDELADAAGGRADRGVVFHASSAGGVYAGALGAPFSELSPVAPLGDYGRAKLSAEEIVNAFGRRTGATTVIGRIANLYGPGQNLEKPQGLISHLCRGYLMSAPVAIYVPMDTLRDYLYVSDAAEMVADALDVAGTHPGATATKIFASGTTVTIGAILGACRTVFRRKPNVILAASKLAAVQSQDLRLRSVIWPEIDARTFRTLPSGIAATLEATRDALSTAR